MQVSNRLETVLHRVELHQRHVLFIRIAQDLYRLNSPVLAEDLVQGVLSADVLLEGTHVQGLGRGVDRQRTMRCEAE